jgi:GTP-binding protein HflX
LGYQPPQAGELTIGGFDEARGVRTGSRAIVILPHILAKSANALRSPEAKLAEADGLTRAIALDVVHSEVVKLRNVQAAQQREAWLLHRLLPIQYARPEDKRSTGHWRGIAVVKS